MYITFAATLVCRAVGLYPPLPCLRDGAANRRISRPWVTLAHGAALLGRGARACARHGPAHGGRERSPPRRNDGLRRRNISHTCKCSTALRDRIPKCQCFVWRNCLGGSLSLLFLNQNREYSRHYRRVDLDLQSVLDLTSASASAVAGKLSSAL